jgi:hypothetical protein
MRGFCAISLQVLTHTRTRTHTHTHTHSLSLFLSRRFARTDWPSSVIVLSPKDLAPCVYLAANSLAPAYKGVELGVLSCTLPVCFPTLSHNFCALAECLFCLAVFVVPVDPHRTQGSARAFCSRR